MCEDRNERVEECSMCGDETCYCVRCPGCDTRMDTILTGGKEYHACQFCNPDKKE